MPSIPSRRFALITPSAAPLLLSILLATLTPAQGSAQLCGAPSRGPAAAGYELVAEGNHWSAENARQHLRILFTEERVRLLPMAAGAPAWEWEFSLERYGGVEHPERAGHAFLTAQGERAEYRHGRLVHWFRNDPQGIEQGLEIPEGNGSSELHFDFAVAGSLTAKVSEDGQTVAFVTASGAPVLSVLDLSAVDAQGREVSVRWERIEPAEESGGHLRLVVAVADHVFPVRVVSRLVTPKGRRDEPRAPTGLEAITALSAPSNDACDGAEVIPASGPFPFLSSIIDLTDATVAGDPPAPSCQTDVSRSVWFAFTPATSAAYTFSVCADAPTATTVEDTVLAVYSAAGGCAGLAEMGGGCGDDTCGPTGLQSTVSNMNLAAGTTYYVVVWSFGTAAPPPGGSSVQLRVSQDTLSGPPPPNDQCGGAEPIPASGPFPYLTALTADISGATTAGDPPAPACQASVSRSIWYSFAPAASGRYALSVCADGPTDTTVDDTVLAVYSASAACSGLSPVSGGCDDDSCASEAAQSRISGIDLTAGTTYYIVAWSYGSAPLPAGNTAVQLRVSRITTPANDVCANPTVLSLDTPASGTTVAAVDDTRLPSGSTCFTGIGQTPSTAPGVDVVYRFTAPDAGGYSFRLSGYDSATNAVLYVSSDCPSGTPPVTVAGCLAAANRTSIAPEEVKCLALGAGQTVLVYVDENALTTGSAFTLEATRCSPESEPNDSPAAAGEPACGIEGSIAPAGDVDFFALGIPAAGSRLFALADGAAGNSNDFDLRVTSATDTLEYDDLNNDLPFGLVAPNVSGSRLTGAASYLRVTHYSPVAQAEPYRLYAAIQPPAVSATGEVEPNDSPATATGAANEYFAGSLSSATDVDVFSFAALAGESIQIGLDLDPTRDSTPFNGSLTLLDSTGTTLLLINDTSASSSTASGSGSLGANTPYAPGEGMVYRIRSSGLYYIKVAWTSGTPGDYLLSIAHACRVGPATDLAVSQIDGPDPAPAAGAVTYSVMVHNAGDHPALVVTLRDELPPGTALVSATPSQGVCLGSQPVLCHLGDLAAGASATVSMTITAPATPGLITNSARAGTAVIDSNPGNDVALETTMIGTADSDGDGVLDGADCAPANPAVWAIPGEATGLVFSGADPTLLQWSPPSSPGGTAVSFDLLRSGTAGSFAAASCLATNLAVTSASDPTIPSPTYYYLVRSENPCGGNLGKQSNGTPRTGASCP